MTNGEETDYVEQFEKLWQELKTGRYPTTNHQLDKKLITQNRTSNSNHELAKQIDTLRAQMLELKQSKHQELTKQIDTLRIRLELETNKNDAQAKQIDILRSQILELKATSRNDDLAKQVHILRTQIAELMVEKGLRSKEIDELTEFQVNNALCDDELYQLYGI